MDYSDADIRTAHQREQSHVGIRDLTGDIVAFHRGLTEGGLPKDLAKDLTTIFTLAALSCCDDDDDGA